MTRVISMSRITSSGGMPLEAPAAGPAAAGLEAMDPELGPGDADADASRLVDGLLEAAAAAMVNVRVTAGAG